MALIHEAATLDPDDPEVVENDREPTRLYVDEAEQIPLVFEPELGAWGEDSHRRGFIAGATQRPSSPTMPSLNSVLETRRDGTDRFECRAVGLPP